MSEHDSIVDVTQYANDNDHCCLLKSDIPPRCLTEECILGIDEAGRGPVTGPMVYGICFCPKSEAPNLKSKGVGDSKKFNLEERESIFRDKISAEKEVFGWMVNILSPHYITTSSLRRIKYNLNDLSHDTAIGLVKEAIALGVKVTEIYVDIVGPKEKYENKLKHHFPDMDKIVVEKKADDIYPIVGAASICAKVTRDIAFHSWNEKDLYPPAGLGYPSEPQTKKFMKEATDLVFGYPRFVRMSWSTARDLMDEKCVKVTWEDDDDDGKPKDATNTPSIMGHFKRKYNAKRKHMYFRRRKLESVTSF